MDDLTAFVSARVGEDEAAAKGATPGPWVAETFIDENEPVGVEYLVAAPAEAHLVAGAGLGGQDAEKDTEHIARHDPARALREVTAMRRRLALMTEAHTAMNKIIADDTADRADQAMAIGRARAATVTVKYDAAVWSDHPDYKQEWAV